MKIFWIKCPKCGNKQKTYATKTHKCVYCEHAIKIHPKKKASRITKPRTFKNITQKQAYEILKVINKFGEEWKKRKVVKYFDLIDHCERVGIWDIKELLNKMHEKNLIEIFNFWNGSSYKKYVRLKQNL